MKKVVYLCDFCGKQVEQSEVKGFGTFQNYYDLCQECFSKADKLKNDYMKKCQENEEKFKEVSQPIVLSFCVDVPDTSLKSDFNSLILKINDLCHSLFDDTPLDLMEFEDKRRNILIGQIQDLLNCFIIRDIRKE